MSIDKVESADISLTVTFLNKPHKCVLRGKTEYTVEDVQNEVESLTDVPCFRQRIIFKGKSLRDPSAILHQVGVIDGSRLLMIGSKEQPRNLAVERAFDVEEKKLYAEIKKVENIRRLVEDVGKGFLGPEMKRSALQTYEKKIGVCTEHCMRNLEALDALNITEPIYKPLRKKLIKNIQEVISTCDSLLEVIQATLKDDKEDE